ncbi:hypothetical protein C0Q70_12073 [Pomacea canaliculata]|uniref:Ig-like domain-containing protein n=1 Tax=Pomacea canaliculata TaxID=400727 RepID=A0A2T7P0I3_POMCA|nr:hypothetical protein C0Q70_12073 [Pomacea canaliculata]
MTRLLCRDAARFIGLALQLAAMSGFVAVMFMFPFCAGQSWEVEIHPEREKYTFDVTQDNAAVSLQCSLGNTSSPNLEWYDGQGKIIPAFHSGDSNPRRFVFRRRNYVELRFLAPETELNSGNYTCRGSGADGVVKEKTIQLTLYSKCHRNSSLPLCPRQFNRHLERQRDIGNTTDKEMLGGRDGAVTVGGGSSRGDPADVTNNTVRHVWARCSAQLFVIRQRSAGNQFVVF